MNIDLHGINVATVVNGTVASGCLVCDMGDGVVAVEVDGGIAIVPLTSCIILE